jgi:hypothetical protein
MEGSQLSPIMPITTVVEEAIRSVMGAERMVSFSSKRPLMGFDSAATLQADSTRVSTMAQLAGQPVFQTLIHF